MKVFVVSDGEYSDWHIDSIFDNEPAALTRARQINGMLDAWDLLSTAPSKPFFSVAAWINGSGKIRSLRHYTEWSDKEQDEYARGETYPEGKGWYGRRGPEAYVTAGSHDRAEAMKMLRSLIKNGQEKLRHPELEVEQPLPGDDGSVVDPDR